MRFEIMLVIFMQHIGVAYFNPISTIENVGIFPPCLFINLIISFKFQWKLLLFSNLSFNLNFKLIASKNLFKYFSCKFTSYKWCTFSYYM